MTSLARYATDAAASLPSTVICLRFITESLYVLVPNALQTSPVSHFAMRFVHLKYICIRKTKSLNIKRIDLSNQASNVCAFGGAMYLAIRKKHAINTDGIDLHKVPMGKGIDQFKERSREYDFRGNAKTFQNFRKPALD
jgi:hypothetical protein